MVSLWVPGTIGDPERLLDVVVVGLLAAGNIVFRVVDDQQRPCPLVSAIVLNLFHIA